MDLETADTITGQGAQETDVKEAPAPSTEATKEAPVNPPAESKPAQESLEEPKIPRSRLNEVIDERNEYKSKLQEMEAKLSAIDQRTRPQEPSMLDKAVNRLKSKGLEEDAARELAETMIDLTKDYTDSKVKPVEDRSIQQEIDSWIKDFSEEHKDYKELEPEMFNVYKALPESTQNLIVTDPLGLELLYSHVKRQKMEKEMDNKFKEGVQAAYENKQSKSGVASVPTTSAVPENYTPESIAAMSLEEYKKHRPAILKAVGQLSSD